MGTIQRKSLGFRYLRFAAIIASILFVGATFSSFYIHNITRGNAESLQLNVDKKTGG